MEKKEYLKPEIKVVFLNDEVILASGSGSADCPTDCTTDTTCHTDY